MNVIVDTSVWSLSLRRNTPSDGITMVQRLRDLIADGRVLLLGAIRQEVLSGIRYAEQFSRLRDYLRAFPDLEITTGSSSNQKALFWMRSLARRSHSGEKQTSAILFSRAIANLTKLVLNGTDCFA